MLNASAFDPYPTRLSEPRRPIPREEPVIHDAAGHHDGPLSAAQLERFRRDGFLVLEGFFRPAQVRQFLDDLDAYQHDRETLRRPGVITEPDSGAIRSIFSIHRLSARFDAVTRDARLIDLAGQILGSDVYIHQSRLNRKPAFSGRGFDWHSDFETWHAEDGMPVMRCFSVSVNLTENNDLNGPLLLVPGSHETFYPTVGATPARYWETSLKRQNVGVPEISHLEDATQSRGIVPARGGPGTVTLFDCNTLHASSDNPSPVSRANLFFVFNSVHNRLGEPYAAPAPRPEWVAAREHTETLTVLRSRRISAA
ncbi:MAG: phytanoyl-CoA dioxygenase family protein [Pseudomonadales bacterium]|jgi:ectoine hydroxylase